MYRHKKIPVFIKKTENTRIIHYNNKPTHERRAYMISLSIAYILILAALFGALCCITGEKQKGNQILINCLTAMALYLIILQLFHTGLPQDGLVSNGLPIVNHVYEHRSIKQFLVEQPGMFAFDFVELVTLIFLFQWITHFISFPNAGLAGKITSGIILACVSILAYSCFMSVVQDNILIRWCVHCVECIITGGSILYPPAMMISFITGLKKNNPAVSYLVSAFPKTAVGKSISLATASAVVFIFFALTLESQYGSVCNVLDSGLQILEHSGSVIVILMGLHRLLACIKTRN